jgi:hypothetical protein
MLTDLKSRPCALDRTYSVASARTPDSRISVNHRKYDRGPSLPWRENTRTRSWRRSHGLGDAVVEHWRPASWSTSSFSAWRTTAGELYVLESPALPSAVAPVRPGAAVQLCELVLPHTLAETSLFDGRRPKMCFLQIPQQATELAVADLLTAVEEVFKAGEEQPLARTFASRWGVLNSRLSHSLANRRAKVEFRSMPTLQNTP